MADDATLTYFDARGLTEIIRITLSFAKIPVRSRSASFYASSGKITSSGSELI